MNYNTCAIAGLWEHPDAWGEPMLRWIPCEWPVLGVLRETAKAKLIQLDEKTAVWVPKKVIQRIANGILYSLAERTESSLWSCDNTRRDKYVNEVAAVSSRDSANTRRSITSPVCWRTTRVSPKG